MPLEANCQTNFIRSALFNSNSKRETEKKKQMGKKEQRNERHHHIKQITYTEEGTVLNRLEKKQQTKRHGEHTE